MLDEMTRFELLETMRLAGGTYARLDRHMARLAASARHFGFSFDELEIHAALAGHAMHHATGEQAGGARRARLVLARDGSARVESAPLEIPSGDVDPRVVVLATMPVTRADPFLYHKTTHRAIYDVHREEHPSAFDVLLWNEEGELTEFTIGNVVAELDGHRVTPPRACGLLAGTFRAELLERGLVRERVMRVEELPRTTGLWLVNSVREWVPVRLGN